LQISNDEDGSEGLVEANIIARIGRSIHQPFRYGWVYPDWFEAFVPAILTIDDLLIGRF
jgi:hypothetical protein